MSPVSAVDSAHQRLGALVGKQIERVHAAAGRVRADRADDQALHDFRVGSRRLRVVLTAARRLYGKQRVRRVARALGRFGAATGALRDAEVLVDTLNATDLDCRRADLVAWLDRRAAHEQVLRDEVIAALTGSQLAAALDAVQQLVAAPPRRIMSVAELSGHATVRAGRAVAELLPIERDDVAALHRLRVRFKRLRYTAEMCAELGGDQPSRLAGVVKQAKAMQDVLGRLHDADQAHRLVQCTSGMGEALRVDALAALAKQRRRLADEAMERLATVDLDPAPRPAPPAAGGA